MGSEGKQEARLAAAAAIGVHFLMVTWLVGYAPPARQLLRDDADEALIIEFVPRRTASDLSPPRASTPGRAPHVGRIRTAKPSRTRNRPLPTTRALADADDPAASQDAGAAASDPRRPLDLSVPEVPEQVFAPTPGPFERGSSLPPRDTRFARAWVPEGDALKTVSWRRPVIGMALNAFGGPPRKCTEVERRLRRHNCLTDEADFEH